MFNILLITLGLSMDCFGVSMVLGGNLSRKKFLSFGVSIGLIFGIFHSLMLMFGVLINKKFLHLFSGLDHWLAFLLLFLIGLRMLRGSKYKNILLSSGYSPNFKFLFTLAFATSIDALFVGVSITVFKLALIFVAPLVGLVTFIISFVGCFFGLRGVKLLHDKARILGGIILIVISIKILIDHILLQS